MYIILLKKTKIRSN